jgi:hypothetical protein
LVHALPHLLYMARAAEKQGQLVRAREIYLKIGREQLVAGAPRAFLDAQQSAEQELRAVEARIPYVTINLEGARSSEVRVTMDEREVPAVLLGVPFPADPGNHVIVANGQGIGSDPAKVSLRESARERVTLKVAAKSSATTTTVNPSATTQPPNSTSSTPSAVATTPKAPSPTSDKGTQTTSKPPILAYTALGVGAVGVGLGTVFLIGRSSKQSDADKGFDDCKTRVCSRSEIDNILDKDKKAATAGTLSIVGFGVGAAAISAGIYLLLTHDSKPKTTATSTQFVPYVGPGQVGATLSF